MYTTIPLISGIYILLAKFGSLQHLKGEFSSVGKSLNDYYALSVDYHSNGRDHAGFRIMIKFHLAVNIKIESRYNNQATTRYYHAVITTVDALGPTMAA